MIFNYKITSAKCKSFPMLMQYDNNVMRFENFSEQEIFLNISEKF